MKCSESNSKKNNWDYCTLAPDKLFGVYIGCCCKEHDQNYTIETKVSQQVADILLRLCIRRKFIEAGKPIWLCKLVSNTYFFAVMKIGYKFYKTWSMNGTLKYK